MPEGRAPGDTRLVPAVEAAFQRESYRSGRRARLIIHDRSRHLTIQILEAGPEIDTTASDTEMNGVPVTGVKEVSRRAGRQPLSVPIGRWASGLYFARLEAPDGRIGFAPFVVAPSRIGVNPVAVVLPTITWQAYNFRDDDGDGKADSWYAGKRLNTVRMGRAFLDRGVPYGYRFHSGFLHWLYWTDKRVDFLSQWDLEHVRGPAALKRAYRLIVFAGHHEYATTREYDLVEGYRDLGGNLMFLSANNYYWRVERHGNVIEKSKRWRDLGRPESALVGVQYIAYQRSPRRPWVVRRTPARRWLLKSNRATSWLAVRPRWRRDRPCHEGVTGSHPGDCRDPERLREGRDGADDLLRDEQRSKSVRRGRLSLHPRDHDGLRRLAALREHLGQADTMTLVRDVTRIRS